MSQLIILFLGWERETPLQVEIYVTFTKENLSPAFRQIKGGQRATPVSANFSVVFSSKSSLCQSGVFWGRIF